MFARAFLQELGNGKLGHEEALLREECERRAIPVTLYTSKRILRRQLPLSAETFIAGDIDSMDGALSQLKIQLPEPNDYPPSLQRYLHRHVWVSTLGAIEYQCRENYGPAVFVKPAERRKNFTGRVFATSEDFWSIGSVSRSQRVWCSEVVDWRSEYRVYVLGNEILSIDNYAGDATVPLHFSTVEMALVTYGASGEAPAAYGIDFGVLSTGETALIEANDGYALGAYQIAAAPYTDLLMARWRELLTK